jgi:hypothetical protein
MCYFLSCHETTKIEQEMYLFILLGEKTIFTIRYYEKSLV